MSAVALYGEGRDRWETLPKAVPCHSTRLQITWAVSSAMCPVLTAAFKSQLCRSRPPQSPESSWWSTTRTKISLLTCWQRVTATIAFSFSQDRYSFLNRLPSTNPYPNETNKSFAKRLQDTRFSPTRTLPKSVWEVSRSDLEEEDNKDGGQGQCMTFISRHWLQ